MENIPKINVGRYAGTPIDQLPNAYLRWLVKQPFPEEWKDIAKKKLSKSPYSNDNINISRHCYDQFSLRFIDNWYPPHPSAKPSVGLGTYIAGLALDAYKFGRDVGKKRHGADGVKKAHNGIVWVFDKDSSLTGYVDVVTCYPDEEYTSV